MNTEFCRNTACKATQSISNAVVQTPQNLKSFGKAATRFAKKELPFLKLSLILATAMPLSGGYVWLTGKLIGSNVSLITCVNESLKLGLNLAALATMSFVGLFCGGYLKNIKIVHVPMKPSVDVKPPAPATEAQKI